LDDDDVIFRLDGRLIRLTRVEANETYGRLDAAHVDRPEPVGDVPLEVIGDMPRLTAASSARSARRGTGRFIRRPSRARACARR
jgi:hypothetical protein